MSRRPALAWEGVDLHDPEAILDASDDVFEGLLTSLQLARAQVVEYEKKHPLTRLLAA
ncbi:MAG TPA: hypothetical protein VFY84_20180 [Jiangellales bacterium]|nr:hypothetical protein [Jiangellales bacterium]